MGLLALCVLTLLSPQDPPGTSSRPVAPPAGTVSVPTPPSDTPAQAPTPTATPPAETGTANPTALPTSDGKAALAAAEAAGDAADPAALQALALSDDAATAARAAWLLARGKPTAQREPLQRIAATAPQTEARLHALQGLLRDGDVSSTGVAIEALAHEDRRVRTVAARLLGKLRRPAAAEPLLGVLQRSKTAAPGPATDVQAALLALHDLGNADFLLRAATAVHDGKAQGTGQALAFCLQQLAPKLPTDAERSLLLAVLDHRELLVRRFAIERLAERAEPAAVAALDGRLGKEGPELRPLLEVALANLRQLAEPVPTDEWERALQNGKALAAAAARWWRARSALEQGALGCIPGFLLVTVWLLARRRRAAAVTAAATAVSALVQPSEEYVEQLAAEAEQLAGEAAATAADEIDIEGLNDEMPSGDEEAAAREDELAPAAADGEWQDDAAPRN